MAKGGGSGWEGVKYLGKMGALSPKTAVYLTEDERKRYGLSLHPRNNHSFIKRNKDGYFWVDESQMREEVDTIRYFFPFVVFVFLAILIWITIAGR